MRGLFAAAALWLCACTNSRTSTPGNGLYSDENDDWCNEDGDEIVQTPNGRFCQHPPLPAVDAGARPNDPCAVGGYCRSSDESCTLLFDDPGHPACQLTQELRCITNLWRANLAPVEIYQEDADCSLPDAGEADFDASDASVEAGESPANASDSGPDASWEAGLFVDAG
ncbi:MAG TPA: hypothetical protein VHO25_12000 [Polyangiaceae bacterium]|nr:hypothetical protein [Polyangiaceae bacterium]